MSHHTFKNSYTQLFYQYINVEEDFVKSLVLDGQTQAGRFFVHEPALSAENALYVLDYERASRVIQTASHLAVGALLTITIEFAAQARGVAMSLAAFCFMGGGGIGTAIGGKVIDAIGFNLKSL
jgi:hypothetical protein